jgi:hypothetical protein
VAAEKVVQADVACEVGLVAKVGLEDVVVRAEEETSRNLTTSIVSIDAKLTLIVCRHLATQNDKVAFALNFPTGFGTNLHLAADCKETRNLFLFSGGHCGVFS